MGRCKTPVDKFLFRVDVEVYTRRVAAGDKEDHQKNQKQRGTEKAMLPK